jgi:hypothetical protein
LLSLRDEGAARLLAQVAEDRRGACWWIVLRDGPPVAGDAGGGVVLLAELRLTRPLGRVLQRLGMSPVVDALDKLVARNRGRLGRFVPDGPAPRRFP